MAANNAAQRGAAAFRIGVWGHRRLTRIRLRAPRFGETGGRIRVSGGITCAQLSNVHLPRCLVARRHRTDATGTRHTKAGHGAAAATALQRDMAMPPYTGEQTDENTRFTPAVLTNANLEVKL